MAVTTGDLTTEIMGFTWKIRDFLRKKANEGSEIESKLMIECSHIVSPSFSLAGADWRLELYRNFYFVKGYISIYLTRSNYTVVRQTVKATFSIKNRDGEDGGSHNKDCLYDQNHGFWGVLCFMKGSELEDKKHSLLPDGTLTVHCQMSVEPSSEDSGALKEESPETDSSLEKVETGASPRQQLDASSQTETPDAFKGAGDLPITSPGMLNLQTDYKKLLESKEEADVCLKVSDQEFPAHKCILWARSSVFSAMFKHDTEEKNSGEVVIEDLDPEFFPDFLQHVYAGTVDTLSEENVFNLYIAADKYSMAYLKAECKSYMERTLSVDTFCDVMILALRYKEDELLKVAIDFFCKNLTKIIVTVKWQMFSKEHNTEANELFIKALVPADERCTTNNVL